MRGLVRRAMDEGAMGLTSALIYTPGTFAKTDELVELAKVASAVRRHVHLAHAQRRATGCSKRSTRC